MAPIMQAGSEGREEAEGEFDMKQLAELQYFLTVSTLPFSLSFLGCTSQHRRLSEASISPPGSSISSPSRVICVSSL